MAKPLSNSGVNDAKVQSVTSIGVNPERERRARMIKYTISMTVRVACLIIGMVVHGWIQWVFFAAAIFLPYVAVVIANDVRHQHEDKATVVEAPVLKLEASDFKIVERDADE
jgi:predicted tellurium resistance membrane protein TerC